MLEKWGRRERLSPAPTPMTGGVASGGSSAWATPASRETPDRTEPPSEAINPPCTTSPWGIPSSMAQSDQPIVVWMTRCSRSNLIAARTTNRHRMGGLRSRSVIPNSNRRAASRLQCWLVGSCQLFCPLCYEPGCADYNYLLTAGSPPHRGWTLAKLPPVGHAIASPATLKTCSLSCCS